jgi:hypothetical protein
MLEVWKGSKLFFPVFCCKFDIWVENPARYLVSNFQIGRIPYSDPYPPHEHTCVPQPKCSLREMLPVLFLAFLVAKNTGNKLLLVEMFPLLIQKFTFSSIYCEILQGCGSGLIQSWSGYGSGSNILPQSGYESGSSYGSGSKLKQNFRRQFLSQIFLKSKFESNQMKYTGVIHQKFVQKVPVVSAILYLFSGKIF